MYRLFHSDSKEVLFWQDVQFDERYPPMEPPSPASPSLPNTSSSPLQGYLSSKDDVDFDTLASPPPPDVLRVPKWAHDIVDVAGPMARDPSNSHCTHAQTFGTGLLSHVILDDP